MKRICDILMVLLVAVAVTSCGSRADRPGLVAIDSLILHDPDSACEALAAYTADSLTNDDDRAYHALLTTIAHYKAYRPATTDSVINIAVSHYDRNAANTDHRMRSLLYKGCVMEELGNPEQAIEYYKRAETACPTDDYFNIGYINMRKAILYQRAFDDSIPICTFKEALNGFRKAGNPHYESITLNFIGTLFVLSNSDSAEYYISQSISLSKMTNDSIATADALTSLCSLYYNLENYKQVTCHAYETVVVYGRFLENRACNDFASISFAKTNSIDSAYWYYNYAPPANNTEDTISMLRAKAEIALAEGDHHAYIKLNQLAVDLADSVLLAGQADKIKEAEAKYDSAVKDIDHLTKQRKLVFVIALLSILIIIVSFCVHIYRRREKYARMELEEAISQVSTSRQELEQVLLENQNRLSELKAQEVQLHQMQLLLRQMRDTHNGDLEPIEEQLSRTNHALDAAESSIKIQDQTLACLDEILRTVFYSGRYNSDQVIDNDSILNMKPEFWSKLYNLVSLKYGDLFTRIEARGIMLNESEKKLIALSAANLPGAIIRRILDLKSIQVVSNRRQKLAKKIIGKYSNFDEIFH